MIDQSVRLETLVNDKKNTLSMAYNSGMIPNTQPLEIMELIPMEHYISEQIMRQLWDYYKERPNLRFTDGMQTSLGKGALNAAKLYLKKEYKTFTLQGEYKSELSTTARNSRQALDAIATFFNKTYCTDKKHKRRGWNTMERKKVVRIRDFDNQH